MGLNARVESFPPRAARLCDIALAAIAESCPLEDRPATSLLQHAAGAVRQHAASVRQALEDALSRPAIGDAAFVSIAVDLRLSRLELLAVALATAVEEDAMVGRVIARMQAPVGGSRPTLGLIAHAFALTLGSEEPLLPALVNGAAVESGLLTILNDAAPLAERSVAVPAPLCLALAGHDSSWPGARIAVEEATRIPLPDTTLADARRQAAALAADPLRALVLRTGSPAEGRAVATAIAREMGVRPAFIDTDTVAGYGPWLVLRGLLPVFCYELAPGERRRLPPLAGYAGPLLAIAGPDGSVDTSRGAAADWTLPVPSQTARVDLWNAALGGTQDSADLALDLATAHRHGAGRIAHLGRLARHQASLAGHASPRRADVTAAAWTGEGSGLDGLAEALRSPVPDEALVAGERLRADLHALMMRCRLREELAEGLGASARTRYRPGVRALFTGPSGTGKTLAAGWMATHLGLPLYRVDLASVTSKYIGETEKNLSQLLARAEQAEVILLFDEADSLFGKRTDISDANDRFANAQTNYLLQRIEHYDGIVLLTSNSQDRFDEAFARRLDCVVDFPAPAPEERRSLWLSHLGPDTTLEPADLNRLAVLLDLNGGHIRNATLSAAVRARADRRPIQLADLIASLEVELRKIGRQLPIELREADAGPRPSAQTPNRPRR
jgi:hypothetical protein